MEAAAGDDELRQKLKQRHNTAVRLLELMSVDKKAREGKLRFILLVIFVLVVPKGLTALVGGKRVPKESGRLEAYGTIDELNTVVGVVRTYLPEYRARLGKDFIWYMQMLRRVQNELFDVGSELATPPEGEYPGMHRVGEAETKLLDQFKRAMAIWLPEHTLYVVADSAYATFVDAAKYSFRSVTRVPHFPIAPIAMTWAKWIMHVDAAQLRPIDVIGRISPRPVLLTHGTLDEVVKLEELCMLAAWMKGLYKRPDFISAGYAERCRAENAACE